MSKYVEFDKQHNKYGIKHELIDSRFNDSQLHEDELYCPFTQFNGVSKLFDKCEMAHDSMKNFVKVIMSLLKDKLIISSDCLVLCFEYCNKFDIKLKQEFLQIVRKVANECLDSGHGEDAMKARNAEWFKKYVLNCNVWSLVDGEKLQQTGNDKDAVTTNWKKTAVKNDEKSSDEKKDNCNKNENKNENEMNVVSGELYDHIVRAVDAALNREKKIISANVENEKKTEGKEWNKLLNIENWQSDKIGDLRQDCIGDIGVLPDLSEQVLWEATAENINKNFDCFQVKLTS